MVELKALNNEINEATAVLSRHANFRSDYFHIWASPATSAVLSECDARHVYSCRCPFRYLMFSEMRFPWFGSPAQSIVVMPTEWKSFRGYFSCFRFRFRFFLSPSSTSFNFCFLFLSLSLSACGSHQCLAFFILFLFRMACEQWAHVESIFIWYVFVYLFDEDNEWTAKKWKKKYSMPNNKILSLGPIQFDLACHFDDAIQT